MKTLGYAILGLLAREELSGYDLKRLMEGRVGYFWQAKHSQIYPELALLEEGGFVRHRLVEQSGRPDKKVYGITEAGREALREWLVEPVEKPPTRDELVLKAYSVWLADPGRAARVFRERQAAHEARLAEYLEIEVWMENNLGESLDDVGSPDFAGYASLRRGIAAEREYAGWCRWISEKLENARSDGELAEGQASGAEER